MHISMTLTANIVERAVMVTLKASSALNREHHQLEYEPPGLEVITTLRMQE
jgi:hypothetical protein